MKITENVTVNLIKWYKFGKSSVYFHLNFIKFLIEPFRNSNWNERLFFIFISMNLLACELTLLDRMIKIISIYIKVFDKILVEYNVWIITMIRRPEENEWEY